MLKKIAIALFLAGFFLTCVYAADTEVTHDFTGPTWHYGGPLPETYSTPWLPPAAVLLRAKLGVRFSSQVIDLKAPMKVTIAYDPAQVIAGKKVKIKVKVEPNTPASGKVFQSAYGLYLPTPIQFGSISVPGLGDILPWFDIDYDLWDLMSFIPKVGNFAASLKDQIGVNMESGRTGDDNKIPLGGSKEYHDTRTLIDILGTVLSSKEVKDALNNKLTAIVPNWAINTVMATMGKSKDGAIAFVADKIRIALGGVFKQIFQLKIIGDPYFKVEGQEANLLLLFSVPGKTSGDLPISFTDTNFHEFEIHIPYFAKSTDRLQISVIELGYHFTMRQTCTVDLGLPFYTTTMKALDNKVVTQTTITQTVPETEFKISAAIAEPTETAGDFHIGPGCISSTAFAGSKNLEMKCDVNVTGPGGFNQTFGDVTYCNAHAIPVIGLTQDTTYNYRFNCYDRTGAVQVQSDLISKKTDASCRTVKADSEVENISITGQRVTPDKTSIAFSWNTNRPASTEVFVSPSSDIGNNYISFIKKVGGITGGYFDSVEGDRILETTHAITVPNLQPDTQYYYLIRSWTFKEDKPAQYPSGEYQVGVQSQTRTLTSGQATVKVKALSGGNPRANVPVKVNLIGDASFDFEALTLADGFTPAINVERNKRYTFSVKSNPIFQDATSSELSVANNAEGALPAVTLNLTVRPAPGGYVYDVLGNPIPGAAARINIPNYGEYNMVTDASGHYTHEPILGPSGISYRGNFSAYITKSGYYNVNTTGRIDANGMISVPAVTMDSSTGTANFTVTSLDQPVVGATIAIRDQNQQLAATLTTDSLGKASFSYSLPSKDSGRPFSARVTPPAGSKADEKTETIVLSAGVTEAITINLNADIIPPQITDVNIVQTGTVLNISFKSTERSKYMVEILQPNNELFNIPGGYAYMTGANLDTISNCNFTMPIKGLYKIKIKIKDMKENAVESPYYEKTYGDTPGGGGQPPTFGFTLGENAIDKITFCWRAPYPNEADFGKYVFSVVTPARSVDITDRSTTCYDLTGLQPNTNYCCTLKVLSKTGTQLYASSQICETTLSRPPVINSFTVTPNPAAENQTVNILADFSDPDSNIVDAQVIFEHGESGAKIYVGHPNARTGSINYSYKIPAAGDDSSCRFILEAQDDTRQSAIQEIDLKIEGKQDPGSVNSDTTLAITKPVSCIGDEACQISLSIDSLDSATQDLKAHVDWGDSKSEVFDVDISKLTKTDRGEKFTPESVYSGSAGFEHTYKKAGAYNIRVFLSGDLDGKTIPTNPAAATIQVV